MKLVMPDDQCYSPTVTLSAGLTADVLHALAGDAHFLRRLALLIRVRVLEHGSLENFAALKIAEDLETAAGRVIQIDTELTFGRVRPVDGAATEN